jgi:hypothetical protein
MTAYSQGTSTEQSNAASAARRPFPLPRATQSAAPENDAGLRAPTRTTGAPCGGLAQPAWEAKESGFDRVSKTESSKCTNYAEPTTLGPSMPYRVYVLRRRSASRGYVGHSDWLERRLAYHSDGEPVSADVSRTLTGHA